MAAEKIMAPLHLGELLWEEFLEPMGITAYRLAKDIGVPEQRRRTTGGRGTRTKFEKR